MTTTGPYVSEPLGHPIQGPNEIAQAILVHAASMDRIADALAANTAALQASRAPMMLPPNTGAGGGTGGPPPPNGAPKPEKTTQQKRGGLIWGQCKDHNVSSESVGMTVLQRALAPDARTWADGDQVAVLEAMKDWGWIDDRR